MCHAVCCFPRATLLEKNSHKGQDCKFWGQAAARQSPDMARQSQSKALPQAGASPTKSSFRHSFACSFFPTGASPSRGPGTCSLTWSCSRQQLQTEERSPAFPKASQSQRPPNAACMSPSAPQPDTGRAGGTLPAQNNWLLPASFQADVPLRWVQTWPRPMGLT